MFSISATGQYELPKNNGLKAYQFHVGEDLELWRKTVVKKTIVSRGDPLLTMRKIMFSI